MSIECKFHLSKLYEIYESGEIVEGYITLNLPNQEPIEYIQIALRGIGVVSWKDDYDTPKQDGSGTNTENIEFRSDENFADVIQQLMADDSLAAGEHNLPFALHLPDSCPASIEGKWGSIQYHLIVTFVTKTRIREKFKYEITVENREDLNENPVYKIPVEAEEVKTFCWLCCSDGRILFTLTTPFGAYVPLQKMFYTLRVENQSMNDVIGYEISITQKTTYTVRTPEIRHREECDSVFEREFDDQCLRLTTRIFENNIQLPPVPPTTGGPDTDSIISIEYTLNVMVYVGGCALNERLTMPLHLGSIPLVESLPTGDEIEVIDTTPRTPVITSPTRERDRPPGYQHFKPPSFSEVNRYTQPPSFDSAITATAPPYVDSSNK